MFRHLATPATLALLAVGTLGCNEPPTAPTVTLTPEAPGTLDALTVTIGGLDRRERR